jgi:metal transporter CNNM
VRDVRVDIDGQKPLQEKVLKPKIPIQKWKSFPNTNKSNRGSSRSRKWTKNMYSDILEIDGSPLPNIPKEEEAVGIITMEDVIEELLQVLTIFLNKSHQLLKSIRKQSYLLLWTVLLTSISL